MAMISEKAKKLAKMMMGPPAFFVFSLIPWLIAANLLSWFRMCEDKGWSVLAMFFRISGLALAIATGAWTVFGLAVWFVQLARVIVGSDSRDEKHVG